MPMEYSMLMIAIAFVVIGLAIVFLLRLLMLRLKILMRKTLELQRELSSVVLECRTLIQRTDVTVKEIGETFSTINTVAGAAKSMGQSVEQTANAVKKVSGIVTERATQYVQQNKDSNQHGDMLQWAELAMAAWQLWSNQRQKHKDYEGRE